MCDRRLGLRVVQRRGVEGNHGLFVALELSGSRRGWALTVATATASSNTPMKSVLNGPVKLSRVSSSCSTTRPG
jgi:hypothetical protein